MAFESPCPSLIAIEARVLAAENRKTAGLRNALTNYALERFLYRLSVSRHRDSFVLRGSAALWTSESIVRRGIWTCWDK